MRGRGCLIRRHAAAGRRVGVVHRVGTRVASDCSGTASSWKLLADASVSKFVSSEYVTAEIDRKDSVYSVSQRPSRNFEAS